MLAFYSYQAVLLCPDYLEPGYKARIDVGLNHMYRGSLCNHITSDTVYPYAGMVISKKEKNFPSLPFPLNNTIHCTFLESPIRHCVLRNAVNLSYYHILSLSLPPSLFIFSHAILQQLDAVKPDGALNEALRQVGLADVILVNKIDLVTKEQLFAIKERIR